VIAPWQGHSKRIFQALDVGARQIFYLAEDTPRKEEEKGYYLGWLIFPSAIPNNFISS
jgi:hypothetical protein